MISHKPEESFISELLPKESVRSLSIAAQTRVRRNTAQVEEGWEDVIRATETKDT